MDFLYQISNLIKQENVIGIEEFYSKHRSSLDIDTEGSLAKFISFKQDDVAKSILPLNLLNIEKGQTAVPVRYVAYVYSKQSFLKYVSFFTRKMQHVNKIMTWINQFKYFA